MSMPGLGGDLSKALGRQIDCSEVNANILKNPIGN